MKIIQLLTCLIFTLSLTQLKGEFWWEKYDTSKLAVFVSPVSELVSKPLCENYKLYTKFPLCCEPTEAFPCLRITQALFNDVFFNTRAANAHESIGILPDSMYEVDEDSAQPITELATLQSNLISFDTLLKSGISPSLIPTPLWLEYDAQKPTIILVVPWFDTITNTKYSAGTRFVYTPEKDQSQGYVISLIDAQKLQALQTRVPLNKAIIETTQSPDEGRKTFLNILNYWLDKTNGVIPYVWGGASFLHSYPLEQEFAQTTSNDDVVIYSREHQKLPMSGLDCSGMIWLARRIAGIPSPFRMTKVINEYAEELSAHEEPQNGDLLWIPGHIMVIGDKDNNMMIESASYLGGFGKMMRIPIRERFVQVKNFKELLRAARNHEPLTIRGSNGRLTKFTESKIFKLVESKKYRR